MNGQPQTENVLNLREHNRRWRRVAFAMVVISLAPACACGAARWMKWRNEIGTNLPLAPYSVCEECGEVDAPAGGRCARAFSQATPAAGAPAEKPKCALPACTPLLERSQSPHGSAPAPILEGSQVCPVPSASGRYGSCWKCAKGVDEDEK